MNLIILIHYLLLSSNQKPLDSLYRRTQFTPNKKPTYTPRTLQSDLRQEETFTYNKYYGEETSQKYQITKYVGFEQDAGSNYDGYYYYYSGDRNPDYNFDAAGAKEKETFVEWIKEFWSHTTNQIIVFVVGAICAISCVLCCALNFFYLRERYVESEESKNYRE